MLGVPSTRQMKWTLGFLLLDLQLLPAQIYDLSYYDSPACVLLTILTNADKGSAQPPS
jgi:hypothetical protein